MKNLIFFQNLNIRTRSEITEPGLKIFEPDPKYRNTRTGSIPLYRNTQKFEIPDPNPNGYSNAHPYFEPYYLVICYLYLSYSLILVQFDQRIWKIKLTTQTPYYPQGNRQTKTASTQILSNTKRRLHSKKNACSSKLPRALLACCMTPHKAINHSL